MDRTGHGPAVNEVKAVKVVNEVKAVKVINEV